MNKEIMPFRPYISNNVEYINGIPQTKYATAICFIKTPTGRWSKKYYAYTVKNKSTVRDLKTGKTHFKKKDCIKIALQRIVANRPKLKKGYTHTTPIIYSYN